MCISAAQAAPTPTPTQSTESAVVDKAEPLQPPNSQVPRRRRRRSRIDPAMRFALTNALKRTKPVRAADPLAAFERELDKRAARAADRVAESASGASAKTPPSALSETPRRAGRGPQIIRVRRAMRNLFSSDGKAPRGLLGTAIIEKVIDWLRKERENGRAPANEQHLGDPSSNVIYKAIHELGRCR